MFNVESSEAAKVEDCVTPYFDALAQEILGRGVCLRFRARGMSMYPAIQNGDILLIEPQCAAEFNIGDVVFYRRLGGTYIVHRLVKKENNSALITKGDNQPYYDMPVPIEQAMGKVIQVEGRGKRVNLKGAPSRTLGQILAWFSHYHSPTQTMLTRQLGRLYWLIGGNRIK